MEEKWGENAVARAKGTCLETFEEKKQVVGHRVSTYKEGDKGYCLTLP